MPGALDVINWIATLLSVGCAVYSWRQVGKCHKYAIRVRAIEERDKLEDIKKSCRTALNEISKFGPGSTSESVMGLDFQNAADTIRTYLIVVRENGHVMDKGLLERHCQAIEETLDNANCDELKAGRHIFHLLSIFLTEIGKLQKSREDMMMEP